MIAAHRIGWPDMGQSLQLLLGQHCHLKPCLPQLVLAMHERVEVSLLHLWWRSPVFPNKTKFQVSQVLASLLETRMVNVMGCYQMPRDLQGHFGHLVMWGYGPQSGYWSKASDHLGCSIWQPLTQNSSCELKLWMNSFSSGAKAHARKLRNYGACISHIWFMMSSRPIHLPPKYSFANMGTLSTWAKVLTSLIEPPDWHFRGWLQTATA